MSGTLAELLRLLAKGGFVMPPLVIGALLLWFALGYRAVLLYRFDFDAALAMDDYECRRELTRFSVLVKSIVRAAPLLGLLGTVAGMIDTFDALGGAAVINQAGGVAGGISEALFSTQMGLLVAVPGLLMGRMLDQKQQRVEGELVRIEETAA